MVSVHGSFSLVERQTSAKYVVTQIKVIISWYMLWRKTRVLNKEELTLGVQTTVLEEARAELNAQGLVGVRGYAGWTKREELVGRLWPYFEELKGELCERENDMRAEEKVRWIMDRISRGHCRILSRGVTGSDVSCLRRNTSRLGLECTYFK